MKSNTKALIAGLMLGAVVLAGCSSSSATLETVSPDAAATIIAEDSSEIILDIRTPAEFDQGIIEGAINIDFYEPTFSSDLDALDKDARYVVYCRSGSRSGEAMSTFADLGFTNVTEIDGGIANWYETGLPVVLP
ncbi:MAG: rhodanese-like domain-containing protein [Actinomycetia bacterium]|nr:rhodanese-like domain-containing protein [Actinomycetes bacterium]